ncbi:hypothetical protein SAMN05421823_10192 [Catalinimonas alkaloidigena]|uniref:Uncharacterized protein n=1 Tax=Catalinimonas alkaloidigena TaxID=1075417 RepID=A0A1G8WK15_9BACT|nr:hypothetical protein [Catalinimonas alkaloidigena]SDJ77900.1 hypothetical protein SAMN05421823_10192 [Catalinimonas alkaloidigena]
MTDIGLYIAYILIGLCIAAALILPLINSLSDPKSLLKVGAGVIALVAVFFIGYALSGTDLTRLATQVVSDQGLSEGTIKMVGGALITMYMLLALAVISIVFTEIVGIFK